MHTMGIQIASCKDPTKVDLSASMSVIPAETLLKSEFTVVMGRPDAKIPVIIHN